MTPMRFVITGCARSGTMYASQLLTDAGVPCEHERALKDRFYPHRKVRAESSSLAVPHLSVRELHGVPVVHLVRAPLDAIASLVATRQLDDDRDIGRFFGKYAPGLLQHPHGVRRAARYWLDWNAMAARHARLTWRLPGLSVADVMALSDLCGLGLVESRVEEALAAVPHTVNHRVETSPVELDELGDLADDVVAAAARYGVPVSNAQEVR